MTSSTSICWPNSRSFTARPLRPTRIWLALWGHPCKRALKPMPSAPGMRSVRVVEQAMAAMTQEAQHSHERLRETTDVQLQALTAQWEGTAHRVADTWTTALHSYTRTQGGLVEQLGGALQSVTKAFDERSNFLVASLRELGVQSHATQLAFDQQRLDGWIRSMETMASALSAEWQRAGPRRRRSNRAYARPWRPRQRRSPSE